MRTKLLRIQKECERKISGMQEGWRTQQENKKWSQERNDICEREKQRITAKTQSIQDEREGQSSEISFGNKLTKLNVQKNDIMWKVLTKTSPFHMFSRVLTWRDFRKQVIRSNFYSADFFRIKQKKQWRTGKKNSTHFQACCRAY